MLNLSNFSPFIQPILYVQHSVSQGFLNKATYLKTWQELRKLPGQVQEDKEEKDGVDGNRHDANFTQDLYSDLPVFGWSLPLASSSFFLGRDNLGHVRKEAFFLRDPSLTLTYSATCKESLCEVKPLKVATHFLCLAHYVHQAGWIIRTG